MSKSKSDLVHKLAAALRSGLLQHADAALAEYDEEHPDADYDAAGLKPEPVAPDAGTALAPELQAEVDAADKKAKAKAKK